MAHKKSEAHMKQLSSSSFPFYRPKRVAKTVYVCCYML